VYATAATVASLAHDPRDEQARQAGEHLLRVAAALAVTGSRAAGSHRSAALVYELGLVSVAQGQPPSLPGLRAAGVATPTGPVR
jgi:hypothetical protein